MTSKHFGSAGNGEEPYSSDTYEESECESSSETITVTICSPSGDAFDIPMKEGECIQDLKSRIRTKLRDLNREVPEDTVIDLLCGQEKIEDPRKLICDLPKTPLTLVVRNHRACDDAFDPRLLSGDVYLVITFMNRDFEDITMMGGETIADLKRRLRRKLPKGMEKNAGYIELKYASGGQIINDTRMMILELQEHKLAMTLRKGYLAVPCA